MLWALVLSHRMERVAHDEGAPAQMKRYLSQWLIVALAFAMSCMAVYADGLSPPPSATAAGAPVASVAALRGAAFSGYSVLSLNSYYQNNNLGGGLLAIGVKTPGCDNGGTVFADLAGNCWYRITNDFTAYEFGAYEDATAGIPTSGHDDTMPLQNWLNAVQPHWASPGISRITAPLNCNTSNAILSGPPPSGVNEVGKEVPVFQIVADNTAGGLTGSAMLVFNAGGCAAQWVGLIGDQSGNYDGIDINGQGSLIKEDYITGGNYNVRCTAGTGEDVQIFDSFLSNAVLDGIHSVCPNFRVERNVIDNANGDAIFYNNADGIFADNTLETAGCDGLHLKNNVRQARVIGNRFDLDAQSTLGCASLEIDGSTSVSVVGNIFQRGGGYAELQNQISAHILFGSALQSAFITFSGNIYQNGNGIYGLIAPDYVYDAIVGATFANISLDQYPTPQNVAVFTPNAVTAGLNAFLAPHVFRSYVNGFALGTSGTQSVTVGAGDAADSTNSWPITLANTCTVNLATQGNGGLDKNTVQASTQYYIYVISNWGGAAPSCMASTSSTGPSFKNSSYAFTQTGNIGSVGTNSTLVWNVGSTATSPQTPLGPGNNGVNFPIAGMAAGFGITDSGGYVPNNTTISSLVPFNLRTTPVSGTAPFCTTTAGSPNVSACAGALTGALLGMAVSGKPNIPGKPAHFITAINSGCGTTPCFVMGVASGAGSPNATVTGSQQISITGNYTITLSQTSTGTNVVSGDLTNGYVTTLDTFTIYPGWYRLIGTVQTDGSSHVTTPYPLNSNLGILSLLGIVRGANFNITSDQPIQIVLPTGATKYIITEIDVDNPSTSLTTAQGAFYTAVSKGGTIIGATTTAYTNAASASTRQRLTGVTNEDSTVFTANPLYLSLTTAQGGAATADVRVIGMAYN